MTSLNHDESLQKLYSLIAQVRDDHVRSSLRDWAASNLQKVQVSWTTDERTNEGYSNHIAETMSYNLAKAIFDRAQIKIERFEARPFPTHIITKSIMVVGR